MNRHLALGTSALALGVLLLQPVTAMADPPAHARNENSAKLRGPSDARRDDDRGGQWRQHGDRDDYRRDDRRGDRDHRDRDWDRDRDRYDHRNRYDGRDHRRDGQRYDDRHRWNPPHAHHHRPGYVVHRLPPRHRVVHYRGARYYYGDGLWYRPVGPRYTVIDPPLGLVVSFLPQFSSALYFGGVPYYRAGPVYYVWNPRLRGYVVTDRPYRY